MGAPFARPLPGASRRAAGGGGVIRRLRSGSRALPLPPSGAGRRCPHPAPAPSRPASRRGCGGTALRPTPGRPLSAAGAWRAPPTVRGMPSSSGGRGSPARLSIGSAEFPLLGIGRVPFREIVSARSTGICTTRRCAASRCISARWSSRSICLPAGNGPNPKERRTAVEAQDSEPAGAAQLPRKLCRREPQRRRSALSITPAPTGPSHWRPKRWTMAARIVPTECATS